MLSTRMGLPAPTRCRPDFAIHRSPGFFWRTNKLTLMQYSPLTPLDDRVAVVTGGARGIGLETTKAFLENGAKVVIVDIDIDNGNATAKKLGVEFIPVDVTDSIFVASFASDIKNRYGRIDIAFNNAGIAHSVAGQSSSDAEWHMIMNTNLHAVYLSRLR